MTGWIIFFGIILFILGVLMIPVHAEGYYKNEFSLDVRFLFFFKTRVIPMKEKEKKEEEQKEKKTAAKKATEKPKKEKRKMTLEDIIDMIIDYVKKYGPGARMILRNIRFHRIELFWKISAEDAAACGIKYGRICGYISSALGFFRNLTKIEKTKFKVYPDFIATEDEIYGGFDLEFNPLIVIIGGLRMAFVFLKDMFESNKNKPKRKTAKPQKNIAQKESA